MGSRGGRRRAIFTPDDLKEMAPPKSADDLLKFLAQLMIEVRCGKLDPRVANSISFLGTGFLRALEVSELERRLSALERPENVDERAPIEHPDCV